jgi:hemerythrin
MDIFKCPASISNKDEHQRFLIWYAENYERFYQNHDKVKLANDIYHYINEWIVNHIYKTDLKLKACVETAFNKYCDIF